MDALDHFSIPVTGLHNGLHEFDFQVDTGFFQHFEGSPIQVGDANVHLLFDKRPDLYSMTFQITGTVEVACDRCLEIFALPIEDTQNLLVKFDETAWEEADVIYVTKGIQKLNVSKYIYEFINLAVPMVTTHDDAGERCNPEMLKYLTEEEDTAEEGDPSNPFRDALEGFNFEN
ncbi:MAG: DUF177 domain-containing protein [Saprospiraceae bacterium]